MSTWDLMDARIHRTQAWGLLPSAVLSVVGAASAARGPSPPSHTLFPAILGKMSKRGKLRRAQAELRRRAGFGSDGEFLDMRGLLRAQLFGGKTAEGICDTLTELRLTRDDMLETLVETVFKGDEKTVALDGKLKSAVSREMNKRVVAAVRVKASDEDAEDDPVDSEDEEFGLMDLV